MKNKQFFNESETYVIERQGRQTQSQPLVHWSLYGRLGWCRIWGTRTVLGDLGIKTVHLFRLMALLSFSGNISGSCKLALCNG